MAEIYIHIPFCLSKCRYCGFNSVPISDMSEITRYCRALEREIRNTEYPITKLDTLYCGGGTPIILPIELISDLMSALRSRGPLALGAEVTIEANPETLDLQKLAQLRSLGFNRLSLGVQSFDDGLLKFMGRHHGRQQAIAALEQARKVGFENVGLDLIYGLPGQTLKQWGDDLKMAEMLGPEHISAYSLSYEPGSEFATWRAQGRMEPGDEDLEADMLLLAHETLQAAGYEHYEVSNFAKPGYRSRHNLNYWRCGDYLGCGAGASSHQSGRRWTNVSDWREYVARIEGGQSTITSLEELDKKQRLFEAIFLGLRMFEGIARDDFEVRWGQRPEEYKPEVWDNLYREGYVKSDGQRIHFTIEGMMIADLLLSRFVP